jgi:hypothetical protein
LATQLQFNKHINIIIIIIVIIIFLHALGRLICSGIDVLPSFPGASTISSSSMFVVGACFGGLALSILSRWLIQICLCLDLTSWIPQMSSYFLKTSFLILSSLVYPLTILKKHISATFRRVISRFVVTHVSLQIYRISYIYICTSGCAPHQTSYLFLSIRMPNSSSLLQSWTNGMVLSLEQNIIKTAIVQYSSIQPKVLSDTLFVLRAHSTICYFVTRNRKRL